MRQLFPVLFLYAEGNREYREEADGAGIYGGLIGFGIEMKVETKHGADMDTTLVILNDKEVRRTLHNNEWWFSVVDVCGELTDSSDAEAY